MSDVKVLTTATVAKGEVMCPACGVGRQPFTLMHHGPHDMGPLPTVGLEFYCTTPNCGYLFKATLTVEGKRKVGEDT